MYDSRVRLTNDFTEFKHEETEQAITERFEKQVAKYGDRIAVSSDGHELTYDELNKRANCIARAILEQRSMGQESVALMLTQGIPVISAIIGVLKSGKIYMPVAPWLPRARSDYMLRNSQASLMVTDSKNLLHARELIQDSMQLVNIDELDSDLSVENLNLPIQPDDLVWLLYTSGSTGQPKGVPRNHRNSLHAKMATINDLHISIHDRMASLGPSETGFWNAILSGASFHHLDIKEKGLADLANWLIQNEITICTFVVTAFRHFVDTLTEEEAFPSIRLVCLISEPVYRRDVELFRRHFPPDCLLVNQMGITEAGTVCRYFVDKNTQIDGSFIPVGYPVSDKEVLILDKNGEEVGLNQIGEIAVKSRYLSEGYWRNPELTQARFLPDPNGGDERIYLTGDLGRMLLDGRIVHLGRTDFQVKIRGHRIEIAEVEMALLNLNDIKEAAVVAREDSRGEQRLIAYLVSIGDSIPTVSMLRRSLVKVLPEHMIPSVFMMMDALPLTPSGKMNRLALPEPGTARPELDIPFVAPRTPAEDTLAEIWSDVLGLDEVGIHDDFFELGGNSLQAVQIMSRVTKAFDRKPSLTALLYASTIEQFADIICQEEWSPPWSSLTAIQPNGSKPPIFCIHACGGDVLFYTDLARHLGRDQPFYGLRAQGLDGKQSPHTRIEGMAAHYISEMRVVQPEGPYFLGGSGVGGMIAFEMAQQLLAQKQEVGLLALIDTAPPRQVSSASNPYRSQNSLGHYVRRSFHHLRHGQLTSILKDTIRKHYGKIALMFRSGHIRRVRNAIEMAPWSYMPEVYPGRIIYFLSEKRKRDPGGAQAAVGDWYELAADGLNVFHIPGDHLGILREPHVQVVAEHLRACLDEVS